MKRNQNYLVVLLAIYLVAGTASTGWVADDSNTEKVSVLIHRVKTTNDRKEKVRLREELGKRTPANREEIDELFSMSDDHDEYVRAGVIKAFESVQDPALAPEFRKRIKKGQYYERAIAIKRTGALKDKEAVPDLIDLVSGYNDLTVKVEGKAAGLRISAAEALGEIGDERAIPVLLKKLGKMNQTDAHALSKFGKKALPQLTEIYKNTRDENISNDASVAIRCITDKEAVPDLWIIVKEEEMFGLRSNASYVLLKLVDNTTSPTYDEVSKYIFEDAKMNGNLKGTAITLATKNKDVKYLMHVVKTDPENRTAAIMFLGNIKDPSVVPFLEGLLKDKDRNVRSRAASSLRKITGKTYDWKSINNNNNNN